MRIRCSQSQLLAGINTVSKAVPSKTSMTILECILFTADENGIKLTANDMELGIETYIEGEVEVAGTIAIEAVSRGSKDVELCEKDKIKVGTVLENVSITEKDCGVKIKCHFMPVEYFIKRCKRSFDFIFFDPPFPYKFHEQLVLQCDQNKMLNETGTILVHRPAEHFMPDNIGRLKRVDQRIYGRSIVDFYKYEQ